VRRRRSKPQMEIKPRKGGGLLLVFSGRMSLKSLEPTLKEFDQVLERNPSLVELDLARVGYLDSAGALGINLMRQRAANKGAGFSLVNLSQAAQGILGLIDQKAMRTQPLIPKERGGNFIEKLGDSAINMWNDLMGVILFLGDFFAAMGKAVMRPGQIRWSEVSVYMEKVGADGLGIVGLISLLLGLIITFMSALQLHNFGADIYVPSLVSVAMVYELGPIMTAILVAGRSGSAFAAEIGTMKVNEEVEALEVMGFDPIGFLAVPKVLATMIVVPLLTLYADLIAILGGMVVCLIGLELTPYTFLTTSFEVITPWAVLKSMAKALTFALLISGIGCQRGFVVRGGAQAVGSATTSAVVAAMFLIVLADSIFAIFYYS
jgi:phospholipid/cholesterol/gamma-HCH transport system permease protein